MKTNMSTIDRILRTAAAIVFGILYYNGIISGVWGIILLVIASIFLVTSIMGFCPLYALLHTGTKAKE